MREQRDACLRRRASREATVRLARRRRNAEVAHRERGERDGRLVETFPFRVLRNNASWREETTGDGLCRNRSSGIGDSVIQMTAGGGMRGGRRVDSVCSARSGVAYL